jgi:hypothetical protein
MDERLVKQLQIAALSTGKETEAALVETLVDQGAQPLTVRHARDTLSAVLGRAKKGEVQLIGTDTDEMAVVMSLKDLAAMVSSSAKPPTLSEALSSVGFEPANRTMTVRQSQDREPLTRYDHRDTRPSKMAM